MSWFSVLTFESFIVLIQYYLLFDTYKHFLSIFNSFGEKKKTAGMKIYFVCEKKTGVHSNNRTTLECHVHLNIGRGCGVDFSGI